MKVLREKLLNKIMDIIDEAEHNVAPGCGHYVSDESIEELKQLIEEEK